jgi:hypothetical protein
LPSFVTTSRANPGRWNDVVGARIRSASAAEPGSSHESRSPVTCGITIAFSRRLLTMRSLRCSLSRTIAF